MIFHFNKMHLQDSNVPMWTVKHRGSTYYVNHMTVEPGVGFCTKETPNSTHTKGSLKIKGKLTIEEKDGEILATVR